MGLSSILWGILTSGMLGVGICTLLGFLGRQWWVFDLFSHFRVQYFSLLLILLAIFLIGGQNIQAGFSAILALANLGLILPIYRKAKPHFQWSQPSRGISGADMSASPTYRVLLANVLQRNQEYHRVRELIQTADPDFILLIEINRNWVEQLQPALEKYPYSIKPLREDNYGLGLFSKFPFTLSETRIFGEAKVPSVIGQIDQRGRRLTIIGTHPPPPKSRKLSSQRDKQMQEIALFAGNQDGRVMLLGDLNISSWSPHFWHAIHIGRLKDSRQGWGLHPSWPVDRPPLMVPIDHILVSDGIAITKRWRGPYTGSDHLPVLADFQLTI